MGDAKEAQDLQKLRTFASDFAAAQARQTTSESTSEDMPAATTKSESARQTLPQGPSPATTPPPDSESQRESAGNPPFHFLRDSSPEETIISPTHQHQKPVAATTKPLTDKSISAVNKYAAGSIITKKTRHTDRESILSSDDDIFKIPTENSSTEEGSIVTDKKNSHPGLFRSIGIALSTWVRKQIKNVTTPKPTKPENSVVKASVRSEQIKAAAASSSLAPRDDHSIVTKRIASQPTSPAPSPNKSLSPITVSKPSEVTKPQWSHIEEDSHQETDTTEQTPTLESKTEAPVDTEIESTKPVPVSPAPVPDNLPIAQPEPEITIDPLPEPTSLYRQSTITPSSVIRSSSQQAKPEWAKTLAEPDVPPPAAPKNEAPRVTATPTITPPAVPPPVTAKPITNNPPLVTPPAPPVKPVPAEPVAATETTPPPVPTAIPEPAPVNSLNHQSPNSSQKSRLLPTLITTVVIVLAIGLGSATAWWLFSESSVATTPTLVIPSDISSERQVGIELAEQPTQTLSALQTASENALSGVTQLYVTKPDPVTNVVTPLSGEELFVALQFGAPGNFIRTIDNVTLGTVNSKTPFLLLKVTSFDTALSGMIAWESSMSRDLSPWFGTAVDNSFDPDARTTDQIRPAFFTDTLIANRDVRLLRDELAEDRLLYSFLDRNTILITTDRSGFSDLLPLIR